MDWGSEPLSNFFE